MPKKGFTSQFLQAAHRDTFHDSAFVYRLSDERDTYGEYLSNRVTGTFPISCGFDILENRTVLVAGTLQQVQYDAKLRCSLDFTFQDSDTVSLAAKNGVTGTFPTYGLFGKPEVNSTVQHVYLRKVS